MPSKPTFDLRAVTPRILPPAAQHPVDSREAYISLASSSLPRAFSDVNSGRT